jgi:hypothetical protein
MRVVNGDQIVYWTFPPAGVKPVPDCKVLATTLFTSLYDQLYMYSDICDRVHIDVGWAVIVDIIHSSNVSSISRVISRI